MTRNLLFAFACLCCCSLFAQDTLRVQTLTWADDARSGFYTFPDNPGETYEKILMRYNMRCHDVAVGSGNTGCREWDYSCNTFITDPNLLDSVRSIHPSHRISGFTGTEFPFTSEPYFSYTQYAQQQTSFPDTATLNVAEVGEEEVPLSLGDATPRSRAQYLYPAEDLLAAGLVAGSITALQLEVIRPGGVIPFLRLRLQEVDMDAVSGETPLTDGFTEVFFRTIGFPDQTWVSFPFYQPFEWDGTSDLLLDVSSNGELGTPLVQFAGSETADNTGLGVIGENQHYLGMRGSGWLEVPSEALGMSQGVTVAFWSYGLSDILPANTSVFEAMDGANRRQMNVHLPWSNGQIYWDCGNDGSGYDRINKQANPEDYEGRWNHWAFTKDVTSGTMEIYLNGELWHSGTGMTRPIMATRMNVGVNGNGGNPYPGDLDNFSMWQRALTAEEIQQIMFTEDIPGTHPAIADLILHYPLNEGTGLTATDVANGFDGSLVGPNWQTYRGREMPFDWLAIPYRFNARWEQGIHSIVNEDVFVVDSTAVYPNTVVEYAVNASNDLETTGIYETYAATETYLYDEAGNILATYPLESEGTINITDLIYHTKRPAKFEILSLVTPYGNGLDLGPEGKTFTFDVTDFGPILKGEKFMSLEMGGQNQEEMDIEFLFITGTPTREVLSIENIWPFARGWYEPIQNNDLFEPRELTLNPNADAYKLRLSVTGHGQNGEFVPREHYLNVDGGSQDFRFDVWKACGQNPIYPQGGTWIFDRAGWCPGMATDLHEYMLPESVGSSVELDYGVNGAFMDQANYLVSSQLVTYGPPNFTLDATVEDVIRPSQKVEHERFNPLCDDPIVVVKNNGTTPITSLEINYGVVNGNSDTYTWSGDPIAFGSTRQIALPVDDYLFWQSNEEEPEFYVSIAAPNGGVDEYSANDQMSTSFEPADILDYEEMIFRFRTNNRPAENSYQIRDASGEVVMQRSGMQAATEYLDEVMLPPGCYSLTVEDSGGDGLDFWYWAVVGQNVGTGSVSFRRRISTITIPVKSFNPDFGGDLYYDFIIPQTVNADEELEQVRRFSIYPNPAQDFTMLELTGFIGENVDWQLLDMTGRVLNAGQTTVVDQEQRLRIETANLPAGLYTVRVLAAGKQYVKEVAVMPR
ncbi:MAG: LamG-like jellyroll fold domain-containing protein [Bacteroidota bacterium]